VKQKGNVYSSAEFEEGTANGNKSTTLFVEEFLCFCQQQSFGMKRVVKIQVLFCPSCRLAYTLLLAIYGTPGLQ
jgi:hypothetical protein